MRILGYTWNNLLIVILLGTTLVLFIKLPISSTDDRTLEESIFGLLEPHQERNENKNKRVIGKRYYGSCPELKEDIKKIYKEYFFKREILSLHKTKGTCNFEETKQLFLNNVLSEALDKEVLRSIIATFSDAYMRKDYGNFGRDSLGDT